MSRIRERITYANVMATIAVFIALGTGAYAASTLDKNEVKSKHIKAGAVKNADLADNSVTAPKVANGSLLGEDFAAGQLPSGQRGEQGERGVQGPAGATNVTVRSVPTSDAAGATVECLAGERAVGGGAQATLADADDVIWNSRPQPETGTPTGWRAAVSDITGVGNAITSPYTVYAVCAAP